MIQDVFCGHRDDGIGLFDSQQELNNRRLLSTYGVHRRKLSSSCDSAADDSDDSSDDEDDDESDDESDDDRLTDINDGRCQLCRKICFLSAVRLHLNTLALS